MPAAHRRSARDAAAEALSEVNHITLKKSSSRHSRFMQYENADEQLNATLGSLITNPLLQRITDPHFPANCRRVNERISQGSDTLDLAAANFLQVLGGCQLLGAKSAAEVAKLRGLDLTERNDSMGKHRQMQISLNNIYVRNGPESYGLVALHFSERKRAVSFLQRNPNLAQTLILAIGQEIVVLFRLEGAKLGSVALDGLRIQTDGETLLYDRSPGAAPAYFVTFRSPVTVKLRALKWDSDHEKALLPTIIEALYGSFSRLTARGKRVPNPKSWAAYLAKATGVIFSRADGHFYLPGSGEWSTVGQTESESLVENFIQTSAVAGEHKAVALDPVMLAKVVSWLKRVAAGDCPVFDETILGCIRERLEAPEAPNTNGAQRKCNMTVRELHEVCREYSLGHDKPVVPLTIFQRRIPRLMAGPPFFIPKSQSVKRDGKDQNGFRGVRVKRA
jgi:hypothetical protein